MDLKVVPKHVASQAAPLIESKVSLDTGNNTNLVVSRVTPQYSTIHIASRDAFLDERKASLGTNIYTST